MGRALLARAAPRSVQTVVTPAMLTHAPVRVGDLSSCAGDPSGCTRELAFAGAVGVGLGLTAVGLPMLLGLAGWKALLLGGVAAGGLLAGLAAGAAYQNA